jgi:hypothetical protein
MWWDEFASLAYVTTKNGRRGTSIDGFDGWEPGSRQRNDRRTRRF